MTDEIKAYYDTAAPSIADEWYGNPVLLPTLEDYLAALPPSPRILDLGCGPGYESMRLQALGAEVVGVDYSPENIRIARERCPQCQFHNWISANWIPGLACSMVFSPVLP
jgi:trans-aconitate methyltransferase